ncbi:hypothetical protein [Halosimplex pelagicum]|uniref:Uncharacterized protein n=1 Tax=Halosimplex pelagicum TaxID=869886 RepID=A0A7D5TVM8_9EURY|nr:hypothetical protein [Halosimplex pelagicum]QLH83354.1 hypothetical protein HZS54_17710 [Halosimplex pelagicum]
MASSEQARQVVLTEDQFTTRPYSAGEEGIVATVQVPSNQVWMTAPGQPIELALVSKQTATVDENTADQTVTLDPEAPMVDYLDDPTAGEYTGNAYIVGYFDSTGDGTPDTQITGSSTVQFNGTFSEDGDFVTSFEVDDTSGDAGTKDCEFYVVQRYGISTIQKRSAGAGNVSQSLKSEDSVRYAFASPNDPSADRQVTWDATMGGMRGILPPKYSLDIVFYDNTEGVALDSDRADNLTIALPVKQRGLKEDEDPGDLRRKVANSMTEL